MFSGTPPRRKAPEVTPEESIVTAAAAIAKAITVASSQTTIVNLDITPKSYSQLSTLKSLIQDGILSQDELDDFDGLRML